MHIFSIFIILLRSGFCDKSAVYLGSDVSLRCEVSLLSESFTLQWEKDRGQTSNTTLIYKNTAYIILHTVSEHSEGEYYCKLRKDGEEKTVRIHTLNVTSNSYTENNKNNIIYRKSSNNSDILLTCKSKKLYESWKWTWEPSPNSQIDLMTVKKGGKVQVKGPIKPGKHSSTTYNNQVFNFHISPVNFSYNGTYRCITETTTYTTIVLRTIRVSLKPPVGKWRNQSGVLTCEVSEGTDPVTLVWLRMKGNRGVLEKQQIMTKKNKKLQLIVNQSKYESLHWKCAVFTENKLRALVPVTISLTSSTTNSPSISMGNSAVTNQENMGLQDGHLQMVIIMASAVSVSVMILLGLLVFKCQKNKDNPVDGLKSQEEQDIHYASVAGFNQGDGRIKTDHSSPEVLDINSEVIYSTIRTH